MRGSGRRGRSSRVLPPQSPAGSRRRPGCSCTSQARSAGEERESFVLPRRNSPRQCMSKREGATRSAASACFRDIGQIRALRRSGRPHRGAEIHQFLVEVVDVPASRVCSPSRSAFCRARPTLRCRKGGCGGPEHRQLEPDGRLAEPPRRDPSRWLGLEGLRLLVFGRPVLRSRQLRLPASARPLFPSQQVTDRPSARTVVLASDSGSVRESRGATRRHVRRVVAPVALATGPRWPLWVCRTGSPRRESGTARLCRRGAA